MFTHTCFIRKNSPELRNKLEKLGYNRLENGVNEWHISIEKCTCLTTDTSKPNTYIGTTVNWSNSSIDCGDNEELFLAIAALRDDSDKEQWFISNINEWFLNHYEKFRIDIATWVNNFYSKEWSKATVEEIIEHFKK